MALNRQIRFSPILTGDVDTDRIQQSVAEPLNTMGEHWIFRSRIVEGVTLTSGQVTQVKHGLGRKPQGWLVVDVDAWDGSSYLYRDDSAVTQPKVYLGLSFSGGVTPTVSLWVW